MSGGTVLYRFYGEDDALLYVGITDRGPRRWREHMADKPWWGSVARVAIEHYDTRPAASAAELVAIATENPLHNIMGRQRASKKVGHVCPAKLREPFSEWAWKNEPQTARWLFSWFAPMDAGWLTLVTSAQEVAPIDRLDALADIYFKWVSSVYTDAQWGLCGPIQFDCCPVCQRGIGCLCVHAPTEGLPDCQGREPFYFQCCCGHQWTCFFSERCYDREAIECEAWTRRDDMCRADTPGHEKKPTFTAWLNDQAERSGMIGDIARDQKYDKCWPRGRSFDFDTYDDHLATHGASYDAHLALDYAWWEWLELYPAEHKAALARLNAQREADAQERASW